MFTLSGFREDLLGVTIFPEVLNNRSNADVTRVQIQHQL